MSRKKQRHFCSVLLLKTTLLKFGDSGTILLFKNGDFGIFAAIKFGDSGTFT
jgi:hypothetical protein